MLYNRQRDKCWLNVRFKIMEHQNHCFRFPEFLFDIVDEAEYHRIEEKRFPLFIGSQFGIHPKPEKYFQDSKEPVLVGILAKSMLSGHVAGLKIAYYIDGQFTELSFLSNMTYN